MVTYVVTNQFFDNFQILYAGTDFVKANKYFSSGTRPIDNRIEIWENGVCIKKQQGQASFQEEH